MKIKNYGLIIDKIEADHYILGGGMIGTKEINPNGDWSGFLPTDELQNIGNVETYNCTGFGTNNAIETLIKFLFFGDPNYSDRFVGICAGTKAPGNSPHTVAESIRNSGEIDDTELPFIGIKTIEEFYSFKNADETRCRNLSKEWLKNYSLKHEWVFNGGTIIEKNIQISQALKRSPVGISVSAWNVPDKDGIYHQEWPDNHWVCCYGETDKAWKVFDSYDQTHKLYSKESDITMAKLYWITKLTPNDSKTFLDYINWIWNIIFPKPPIVIENTSPEVPAIDPTKIPIKKSDLTIALFCVALQNTEGYFSPGTISNGVKYPKGSRSWRDCNPGCLAPRDSLGLHIGVDDVGLAIFKTYADGFKALTTKITNICTGKSANYSPDMTILQFCQKYSPSIVPGNYPENKAKSIARELKCSTDLRMCDLIV